MRFAYATFEDLMGLTETLIRDLAVAVLGDTRLPYQGAEYDLSKPFSRTTVKEAILRFNPDVDPETLGSLDLARRCARERGFSIEEGWGLGKPRHRPWRAGRRPGP